MNTKVKVGIAAAIVAALVALIVLDQKTTPKEDVARPGTSGDTTTIVGTNGSAEPPAPRLRDEEIDTLLRNAQQRFGNAPAGNKPGAEKSGIKVPEEKNEKRIPSSTGEEYVIKERDTVDSIAKAKYGSSSYAGMILEANPGLKATALRVGKTITLPAKGEKKAEEAPVMAKDPVPPIDPVPAPIIKKSEPATGLATVDGKKVYTVQAGDTLTGISSKVYNTSRHYQKIYEANKDVIDDPNTLQVGAKLVMPDLPAKAATPNGASAGTVATTSPAPKNAPAGAKTVQVAEGQSLWKIAEKFAKEKKVGIHDMIKLIVAANPDKLKDESSLLKLGMELIIPE
jgi:nucleoid-associated protein YgaU